MAIESAPRSADMLSKKPSVGAGSWSQQADCRQELNIPDIAISMTLGIVCIDEEEHFKSFAFERDVVTWCN